MKMTSCLSNEMLASHFLERMIWQDGPVCPHCRSSGHFGRLNGNSTAVGTWKCYDCRKLFSARSRTIFYNSHIPLHASLQTVYLLAATDCAIGGSRLAEILGISLRSAWLLKRKLCVALETHSADAHEAISNEMVTALACAAEWQQEGCPEESGSWSCSLRYKRFMAAVAQATQTEVDQRFIAMLQALLGLVEEPIESDQATGDPAQLELMLEIAAPSQEPSTIGLRG